MRNKSSAKTKKQSLSKKKLYVNFFAPALALVITLSGVLVASQLNQSSQDLRSDASTNQMQIASSCQQFQVSYLYVRTTSNNGKTWNDWKGPNYAVTAGNGMITGFSAWTDASAVTQQQAVRGGELWVRSLDRSGKWSDWSQGSSDLNNKGAGSLTSFSSHFFNFPAADFNGKIRQYAVKGGQLWVRTSTSDVTREPVVFDEWTGPNGALDGVGKGELTGFSSYEGYQTGRYENKQYAVKGGQLFVRTSTDNVRWSPWSEPNTAADSAGSGTLTHFSTIIEGSELKQYAVKESTIEACPR